MGTCCTKNIDIHFQEAREKKEVIKLLEDEKERLNYELKKYCFDDYQYFFIRQCLEDIEQFSIILSRLEEQNLEKMKRIKDFLQEFFVCFYGENFDRMNEVKNDIENKL